MFGASRRAEQLESGAGTGGDGGRSGREGQGLGELAREMGYEGSGGPLAADKGTGPHEPLGCCLPPSPCSGPSFPWGVGGTYPVTFRCSGLRFRALGARGPH